MSLPELKKAYLNLSGQDKNEFLKFVSQEFDNGEVDLTLKQIIDQALMKIEQGKAQFKSLDEVLGQYQ